MNEVRNIVFLLCVTVLQTSSGQILQQADIDRIANDLKINARVLDNLRNSAVSHDVRMTFENTGLSELPSSGWTLYFHSFFLLYPDTFPNPNFVDLDLEKVKVSMIHGDLYSIQPITGFKAIQPNETRYVDITVAVWSISRTDFMPRWYVAGNNVSTEPKIVQSTASMDLTYVEPFDDVRQWKRYNFDRYNPYTAQQRFRRVHVQDAGKAEKLVIPTPKMITVNEDTSSTITINNAWKIYNDSVEANRVASYLSNKLGMAFTTDRTAPNTIVLMVNSTIGTVAEAYHLYIMPTQNTVHLEGKDARGLFYSVQSFISILDGYNKTNIPEIMVMDEPRYGFRGMHIDVARNFHGVDDIKRLLDAMAMYKLNTLHFHLTDDEGWRLEIPSIPELTEVGGHRCHDLSEDTCIIPQYGSGPSKASTSGSGYYTVEDYKNILRYAEERHIEVIPEVDMPGHAHAAIAAMEKRYRNFTGLGNESAANMYRLRDPDDTSVYLSVQYWMDNAINPCINSTYNFIGRVLDDIISMHADIQPLKTFHHGGDEVAGGAWENSTACKNFLANNPSYNVSKGLKRYFVERVSDITNTRGLAMGGWEDGFIDGEGNPFDLAGMDNHNMSANAWDNVWEWGASERPHVLANAGYKVIMSQATHLYFDHPYEPDPEERGLYWAPRFTDTYKTFTFMPDDLYANIDVRRSGEPLTLTDVCGENMEDCAPLTKPENIIGMQGHLWSETSRTSENIDYMIFPRFLALAERAWHKALFEYISDVTERHNLIGQDWQAFANTIGYKELARLEKLGIQYRVPPPGARVENGNIEVATTFPGLKTEISHDQGNTWSEVNGSLPFPNSGTVHLRTRSKDLQRYSRHVQLFQDEPVTWSDQSIIDYISHNVEVTVSVVDNLDKTDNYITMELKLKNTGSNAIHTGTWKIYLYSLYGLKMEVLNCGLRTGHVNGGLFYVTPDANTFSGLEAGQTITCTFHNKWWSVTRTDQFPNWYASSLGMVPRVIRNTADETLSFVGQFDTQRKWKRTTDDRYNPLTPEQRYDIFELANNPMASKMSMVVPTPFHVMTDPTMSTRISIGSGWKVHNSTDFSFAARQISEKLHFAMEDTLPGNRYITFIRGMTDYNVTESYHVDVDPDIPAIRITTNDEQGALYAAQTVIALVRNHAGMLHQMTIKDKPRFSYRGLMLDVARNFKPKKWIFKMLDAMAMYKMNKLHFHLTDDEGWRVEIPGIPELTQISGKRCHSDYQDTCVIPQLGSGPNSTLPGSGFYTIQEYRDILQYAADRHIEVIPEVDMPGHSTAAIQAMAQREVAISRQMMHGSAVINDSFVLTDLDENVDVESPQKWRLNAVNPCLNSTYAFVRALVEGLKLLHEPVMPLTVFHVGGDEVPNGIWNTSAACKALFSNITTQSLQREFVRKVADIVASFDLDLGVWEDGVYANNSPNPSTDYKSSNVYVYPWNSRWDQGKAKRAYEFADEGYKVVLPLSTHLYFDQPQEQDPEERGLYWASRVTDVEKVFAFMPDDIFANADVTRMGIPVTLAEICNSNPCPTTSKPENIIGMQGVMFSETMRTEEQFHHMGFPRIVALAERAWHKAPWENNNNIPSRDAQMRQDFASFVELLGTKELPRLEQMFVFYRVPPPGAKIEGDVLKVNTRFPNHPVEYSTDNGQSWTEIFGHETGLPDGSFTVKLRSRSPVLKRYSRVVEVRRNIISSAITSTGIPWLFISTVTILLSVLY